MFLEQLAQLRKNKEWSLQKTADLLGIAKSTYAGYESGYRQPSLESLIKLADLFGTSTDYLLDRVDPPTLSNKKIELTDKNSHSTISINIDNKKISEDELIDFIAFVRAKRQLLQK
ncbi:helix-turn-helix domain-containing protein [Bacillus taeanensis]|uniref:Transcriptional regulator n=1 Tax=Bacillus taeanensis TaxID=273032 RepID=A0A366XTI1_9BACI|nr:helix-turn-helix transcriptional regulator [Bacillus taeanensis]RBW68059.1 transcriptional regulator [Bacillus taeanensis]